ncbi:ABC transporter permease subunit [Pseudoroseomonas wenyumeiae]|uniref:ABC transporter permease subunit n=1 Tax=Teichococcus wenyumeiae TaxID=2478470 RepID=A0A3A9JF63_9PROT|nr:carbohydrate ABC transporter permease [Pseudoroseomonas wenyumeiae]RKK02164.1 carbohydrate ABC transporter permease [Pseudoroseomonas wenyumeiae]RMI26842.1 ABC transporter permease subunit [Pseudoroseomonas wenyumeiae]
MAERAIPLRQDLPRLLLLALAGLLMLMPYIWMAAASVKPLDEIFRASLSLFPERFHGIENYGKVFARIPVFHYLWNGIVVCGGILFFQLLFAIPAGYALAKLRFPGKELAFGAVMLGLLVPPQVQALPLYVAFSEMELLNTYTALIAPFTISAFAIFLFRQFFKSLPDDLIHAARLDGFSEMAIVWRVVLPNAWPAATAFAIFSVVAHWNDLFWPLIVVNGGSHATPALGVMFFRSDEAGDDFGALMAAAVIMTAPLVIAFLLAQRRFVEGIATTGLKG